VEGLRWVLTRRAAMTLAITALMILGTLRVFSMQSHNENEKKKSEPKDGTEESSSGSKGGRNATDKLTGTINGEEGEGIIAKEGIL
jgi:hypothetical protein